MLKKILGCKKESVVLSYLCTESPIQVGRGNELKNVDNH